MSAAVGLREDFEADERGATAKQIAAVSGHKSLGQVERYTRATDQAILSRAAVGLLPDEE